MRRRHTGVSRFLIPFFLAVLFLAGAKSGWAQSGKVTISGRVTDSSGAVLKGAKVSLDPTAINVVSDVQGQFFINDLDPGTYMLTVTYVGFAPFTKTVDVAAGGTVTVDAVLKLQTQSLEVLVTARDRPPKPRL